MELKVETNSYIENEQSISKRRLVMTSCCDEMREAWNNGFISYGERDGETEENTNVNIYKFDEDENVFSSFSIKFCPFCSTKIAITQTALVTDFNIE